jgi:hypothetical protein
VMHRNLVYQPHDRLREQDQLVLVKRVTQFLGPMYALLILRRPSRRSEHVAVASVAAGTHIHIGSKDGRSLPWNG